MTDSVEETLVLIKPDGVARNLIGEILGRIEAKGYQLVDLKLFVPERALLAEHYAEHEGKPFYEPLVEFMESGPSWPHGLPATASSRASARSPVRPTHHRGPGTIRGDLGRDWGLKVQQNLVHGSDSPESAARELALWSPSRSPSARACPGCNPVPQSAAPASVAQKHLIPRF